MNRETDACVGNLFIENKIIIDGRKRVVLFSMSIFYWLTRNFYGRVKKWKTKKKKKKCKQAISHKGVREHSAARPANF